MNKKVICSILSAAMLFSMTAGTITFGAETEAEKEPLTEITTEKEDPRGYRFTWVNPIVGLEYWSIAEQGMKTADEQFGTDTQTVGPTEINVDEMVKQIDAAVAAKADGIITMALDAKAIGAAIDSAVDAGVPVVCIDTDAPESKRAYYAGTSNYDAGFSAGEEMAEMTGGKATIGILMGGINAANMVDRVAGFKDAIPQYPDMKIVTTEDSNADLLTGTQKAQAMMQTYPEMDAIFGTSSTDAQAAGKVAEEMGTVDKYCIIGFDDMEDTLDYIRKGVVDATTVQKPYLMGYLGVKLLVETIEGNGPKNQILDTGVVMVTKDNVDTYADQ